VSTRVVRSWFADVYMWVCQCARPPLLTVKLLSEFTVHDKNFAR
jgi:hypothetical protein